MIVTVATIVVVVDRHENSDVSKVSVRQEAHLVELVVVITRAIALVAAVVVVVRIVDVLEGHVLADIACDA